jgi:hypothetical protein
MKLDQDRKIKLYSVKTMPTQGFALKTSRHKNCFIIRLMKVISLQNYKENKVEQTKDQTWLYSISYDQLFTEFIETFNKFEADPCSGEIHEWLDQVSDALNERFYNKKSH